MYEESLKDFESLIVIAHSSKISSSYNLALKISEMFTDKDITVIDSQTITIMEGMLVFEAAKMAQVGASKNEIIKWVNRLIPYTHGVAIMKSLDYLRKGGRISFAKQVIGNLANFRPVISVEDGLVKNIGRVRGFDKGLKLLKSRIPNILKNRKIDLVVILHSLMPDEVKELQEFFFHKKINQNKSKCF